MIKMLSTKLVSRLSFIVGNTLSAHVPKIAGIRILL